MGAPVTWFEINSRNSKGLRDFYAKVFDWSIEDVGGQTPYAVVGTGKAGAIGGGIGEAQGPNQVVFYVEVDDPQAYLERIEGAGGRTIVPVITIPDVVTFAQFADPEGNVVGLIKR